MLMLVRAYRNGRPMGDPTERRRVTREVEMGVSSGFRIIRSADTYLDPYRGEKPDHALGGIAFWMVRQ